MKLLRKILRWINDGLFPTDDSEDDFFDRAW
jgi:hypothetical protein